jgi:type I restriction enzyme S subunit
MALMRVDRAKAHPRFLLYAFLGPEFQELIRARTVHGSTVERIALIEFPGFPISVPSLEEQRAIASVLGALDDKIELNRRMNETLEAMARAVFKSWFVDFDPVRAKMEGRWPFGMDAATAALFPSQFTENGGIPRGWHYSSLGELFPGDSDCVLTGPFGSNLHASDYRETGVPLILVKHVLNGEVLEEGMPLVGEHKAVELGRYRLAEGDIVFTRVGAVGRSALVDSDHAGWLISGQLLRVRVPRSGTLNCRYLAQVFAELSFIGMVEAFALGTTRPSLNTDLLRAFEFLVPPIGIQDRFALLARTLDSRRQSARRESKLLAQLRDTLLPKLVCGEIRLKDAEKQAEAVL